LDILDTVLLFGGWGSCGNVWLLLQSRIFKPSEFPLSMQRKSAEAVSQVWSSLICGSSYLGSGASLRGGTVLVQEISLNSTSSWWLLSTMVLRVSF